MATLVTPSAKSHERVTGRWIRDIQADSKRDWAVFYAKLFFGTPTPWLIDLFLLALFLSRAAVEISAWIMAILTAGYIIADRFSRDREFTFFRVGSDLHLLCFVAVALAGLASLTPAEALNGLGALRWIPLLYLFSWFWQLFPGLNRVFSALYVIAALTASYAIWQHFGGLDIIRGMEHLSFAPLKETAFFVGTGFFRHAEILGTILAMLLPIPATAFMAAEKREKPLAYIVSLTLVLLLAVAIFWTYKPSLWIAAGAGLLVTMILQSKRQLVLFLILSVFFLAVICTLYGAPNAFMRQIGQAENIRAENQRAQINRQVAIWRQNTWIGAGMKSESVQSTTSLDGNVYFQILAQTGALGLAFYLMFSLNFLLGIYRIWRDIPRTHYWHRVLASGGIAGLVAFHVAGLFWSTLSDSHAVNLSVFLLSALAYLREHYDNGLVPDDFAL